MVQQGYQQDNEIKHKKLVPKSYGSAKSENLQKVNSFHYKIYLIRRKRFNIEVNEKTKFLKYSFTGIWLQAPSVQARGNSGVENLPLASLYLLTVLLLWL